MLNKRINKILNILIITLILALFLGTIFVWFTLPADIPNHIDSAGNIKDYMSKNFLFFISIMGCGIGLASFKLSKHPEMCNYIVTLTDKNRDIQYSIVTRMTKILSVEFLLIFGCLEVSMIYTKGSLGIILLLISVFITLSYYIVKSKKHS